MPTLTHIEGWDHQADVGRAVQGGGGATTQLLNRLLIDARVNSGLSYTTTTVHHSHTGSAALRILNPAGAGNWQFIPNSPGSAVQRLWFQIDTLGNVDIALFRGVDSGSANHDILIRTSGQMRASVDGTAGADAGAVSTGVPYMLEWRTTVDSTTHSILWKVYRVSDGASIVAERTDSKAGMVSRTLSSLRVGNSSSGITSMDLTIDDWAVSETSGDYPLGDGYSRIFRTDGKNTHNPSSGAFQNFSGSTITDGSPQNAHLDLDDLPSDSSTGITQTAVDTDAYLDFTLDTDSVTGTPNAARLITVMYPAGTAANNFVSYLSQGGSDSGKNSFDASTTANQFEYHCGTYSTKPSGGAWTSTALQATSIKLGESSTVGTNAPKCSEAWLMVDFPVTTDLALSGGFVASQAAAYGGSLTGSGNAGLSGGFVSSQAAAYGGQLTTGGASASVSVGSMNAVDDGTLQILIGVANGLTSFTPGSGFTEKFDLQQNLSGVSTDQTLFCAYKVASPGATGFATGTLGSAVEWAAIHLLITPAPILMELQAPNDNITFAANPGDIYNVSGTITTPESVDVTINGIPVTVTAGTFTYPLVLATGSNQVDAIATESSGAARTVTISRMITVTEPTTGGGGGPSDPVALSTDAVRIQKIVKNSGLDPR